jgi:hypothetical protein
MSKITKINSREMNVLLHDPAKIRTAAYARVSTDSEKQLTVGTLEYVNSEETNEDGTLPQTVIDKMRNQLKNDPNFTNSVSIQIATDNKIKELELAKAKLIAKYK